jgi:hypothetical protein
MTKMIRWFSGVALMAGLLIPAVALAEHHEEKSEAVEQRSGQANDRSNAQWQDDATRGQERAEEVRGKKGEKGKGKGKSKGKGKKGDDDEDSDETSEKAAGKGKKGDDEEEDAETSDEAAGKGKGKGKKGGDDEDADAETSDKAAGKGEKGSGKKKGFWSRMFGGDDDEEEAAAETSEKGAGKGGKSDKGAKGQKGGKKE